MVAGGFGFSRKDGKVYLVKGAYPGELVEILVEKERKDVVLAKTKCVLKPSNDRISPPCEHFKSCGGCEWMDVDYERQLEYKAEIFVDQMSHTAKMKVLKPTVLSTSPYHYRNKVEFAVNSEKLGFFRKGTNDFISINRCFISSKRLNKLKSKVEGVLNERRKFALNLDRVMLRVARENMLVFVSSNRINPPKIEEADNVISLKNHSHSVDKGYQIVHKGRAFLGVNLNGIEYTIPAKSFFQVNYQGAIKLAQTVKKYANEGEKLLDLYCGVGFLSLQLADSYKRVVGVESSNASVKAAIRNAKINGIFNIRFISSRVQNWVSNEHFDAVLVDPPRSGIDFGVIQKIVNLNPSKVIYASCDVTTLARDVKAFMKSGYSFRAATLIDMFPQTHHFEVVALLKRDKGRH